jgi:hypothetical protein
MSATTTQTLIAASAPRQDIVQATSVKDIAQAGLDSPQLLALLTTIVGPIVRQPGNSDLFGAAASLVVGIGAYYGFTISQPMAAALSTVCFVVFARIWQYTSIWLGKRKALVAVTGSPVQPAPASPPAP